jgi:NADH dehydrogenase [ubiquinone] 1 alpha subcomplex assembly factor 5
MIQAIFNRSQHFQNRTRFSGALAQHDVLFNETAAGLVERLSFVRRNFQRILEVGQRHKGLSGLLLQEQPRRHITQADFDAEEKLLLPSGGFDLVISNLSLHWINDLPGALIQMRRALKPDGFFLATLLGGDTLHELRECLYEAEMEIRGGLSPRISPFMNIRDGGMLLQRAGFALPVAEREKFTFSYPDIFALMKEIRGMGEGNAAFTREKHFTPKKLFFRAQEIYRQRYPLEEGIQATFEIMVLAGWTAHESQQQPLRPGTAEFSLAEALNVRETKAE